MTDLPHSVRLCAVLAISLFLVSQAWAHLQGQWNFMWLDEMKVAWREQSRVPRDRELNEGLALGYRTLEYDYANADYRFMLASMHAWREKALRLWPAEAAGETKKVVENLKAALVRRPSWFEAWILLALVKYQAREIDHDFRIALERSMETGPYETAVHHGLAFVALRFWDKLAPDLRARVATVIRIALNNPRVDRFVVKQIVITGHEDLFRHELESDDRLAGYLNKFLEGRNRAL